MKCQAGADAAEGDVPMLAVHGHVPSSATSFALGLCSKAYPVHGFSFPRSENNPFLFWFCVDSMRAHKLLFA